jgi:hypothetical protein
MAAIGAAACPLAKRSTALGWCGIASKTPAASQRQAWSSKSAPSFAPFANSPKLMVVPRMASWYASAPRLEHGQHRAGGASRLLGATGRRVCDLPITLAKLV